MGKKNTTTIKRGINQYEAEAAEQVKKAGKAVKGEATAYGKSFIEQLLGWDLHGSKQSSESTEIPGMTEPLIVKDPATGAVEVFNKAKHTPSESSSKKAVKEKPKARQEAAMDYHSEFAARPNTEKISRAEVRGMYDNIEQIKMELQRLVQSSKMLQIEFGTAAVEQTPVSIGKYHVTFFEWLLIVVRTAREKVEDSGAWLSTVRGKNGKKKGGFDVTNGQMHQSGERTTIQNAAG